MSGVDDSDTVSSRSDEGISYITTPVQDGFDHRVTMDIPLCGLASTEDTNTASVMSNPEQEDAPHGSVIVSGDFINGQQDILELNFVSFPHLESSEHDVDKSDNPYIRISVLEEKNETLEKQKEALEKQIEKLKKELEIALSGSGVVQSKEEQFRSTSMQQEGFREEEVDNSVHPSSFHECKEDARKDMDSTEGDSIVPQEASCDCIHLCNQQLTDCSNQALLQNKHQMFVKPITADSDVRCTSIVPYCRPRWKLTGEGVLIAILGPPCQTDGVPEMSIILKQTMSINVQADACESKLLKLAYQRAPGSKFCLLQTTFDNSSMLVNPGVTAEALSFLVANWPQWKRDLKLHTLIVVIPYGGKYKVDEEKAVNEARSYGIIIVAASGWSTMGIAFPAKLGAVISVAATRCDGTLAPFSPKGRELDFVDFGLLKLGSDFIFGTGISTIGVATDLALLFQHFSCTQGVLIRNTLIDTYVLRALFELIAGDIAATGCDVMAIIDLPNFQVKRYIEQILWRRDRRAILPDPMQNDALFNTKYWSSENINEHYKTEDKDFPHLSGRKITIGIIDEIKEKFLHHLKDHGVEVCSAACSVKYFRFGGTMLCTKCCVKHIKGAGGHGLQCAAIIANTAPNCTILMIIRNDLDRSEKVALSIAMEQEVDILILSSVTTDTVYVDYFNNINAHLSCRIVLCAAGNEGKCDRKSTVCYPSCTGDVIVIGACDRYGKHCPYSSCGRQVDFLCPGQFSIADSSGRGGTCYSTSAAAGLIALLLEYIDQKLNTAAKVKVFVSTEEEWKFQTLSCLARNTHLMRALLSSRKLLLCQHIEHAITEGFGMLLIDNLNMLTPDGISQVITKFYTD